MRYPDTSTHDAVMSWLQDLELKDHRLGDARSGNVRRLDVTSAILRLQEKAYEEFPATDRRSIDALVRAYIDPMNVTSGTDDR